MVCQFLAEGMRSRKLTLKRASEITEKVLANYNLIDSEADFLSLIKELSKDFEELSKLEKDVLKQRHMDQRRHMENLVKDYVISNLHLHPQVSLTIMEEASKESSNLEALKQKFPEFNLFVQKHDVK